MPGRSPLTPAPSLPPSLTVLGKLDTLSSKVATKVADLQNQFGPLTQSFWAKMTNEVGVLTRELNKDLTEVMKPRLENIQKKWQEKMGPLGQDLLDRVQKQLQGLQEKLGQLGGKVLDRARQQVERARVHMNSLPVILTPLGAELRQCMEPYSEHLRDQLQTLREAGVGLPELREQLLSLRKQAEPTLKEMHEDLQPLWESFQDTFLPFVYIDIGDISQGLTAQ